MLSSKQHQVSTHGTCVYPLCISELDGKCDTLLGLLEVVKHPSKISLKRLTFYFGDGGGGGEVQLDLKVPHLPTFHFWRGGG